MQYLIRSIISTHGSVYLLDTVQLKLTDSTNPDLLQLITQLDEELYAKYPAEEVFIVDFNDQAIHDVDSVI